MITEIAQIDIKPGMESEFEAGVKNASKSSAAQGIDPIKCSQYSVII